MSTVICKFLVILNFAMELNALEVIERIKQHLSSKELEELGFSTGLVSNWKKRNTIPKSEDLYKISQAIGVSMEYLLTGEDTNSELPPDEIEILKNYRLLDESNKAMIQIMLAATASEK